MLCRGNIICYGGVILEYITTNKIKSDDIFVIQFDTNDENFDFELVIQFAEKYYKELPEESSVILMPNYMTIDSMDKESFRTFLDMAEEFYKTL